MIHRLVEHASRVACALFLLAAVAGTHPAKGRAQAVPAAYGLVAGATGGVLVTTGVFVAKARGGSFLYSLEDALAPRWELIPAVAMPIGGFAMGLEDDQRLARSIAWGGAGFAAGALVGYAVGDLFGETSQARWAGAVVGSAAGLLGGSIVGAVTYDADSPPGTAAPTGGAPALVVRLPL
ncbi:MAG: hypothetical protein ACODAA_07900 [Gemmatimonadota bacterium]